MQRHDMKISLQSHHEGVPPEEAVSEEMQLLEERAGEVLQLLDDHPNIVQFVDCFEETDKIYLVLELVRGGALCAAVIEPGD